MQSRHAQLAARRNGLLTEGAELRRDLRPAIEKLSVELSSRRNIGAAAALLIKNPAGAGLMGMAAWSVLRARRYPWMQIVRWLVMGTQLVRMIRGRRGVARRR